MPLLRKTARLSALASIAAIAAVVFAAGCSSGSGSSTSTGPTTTPTTTDTFGGSATATSVDVTMPSVVYTPNRIDIAKGGTIRFIFAALAHDVRFGGNAQAPSDIPVTSNTTVSRTFANSGTFTFLCTLHANMTGTVVVH